MVVSIFPVGNFDHYTFVPRYRDFVLLIRCNHPPRSDDILRPFCAGSVGLDTLRDIVESLARPLDFDERHDEFLPLFHSSVTSLSSLRRGMRVTGRVENVTSFGAFCDIGVQQHAYIPRSAYPRNSVDRSTNDLTGLFSLHLGDRFSAFVAEVNVAQGRICLERVSVSNPPLAPRSSSPLVLSEPNKTFDLVTKKTTPMTIIID
ncbi:unnamed protein product [Echinostoma caproni]|uniref:S1 motif domain-containing protein n=1 Tax=Echinostoma caproni TaxID=27848 RepID=A0A183APS0_9TREM|nr:unnamed protein product [Echinostoma caproni]